MFMQQMASDIFVRILRGMEACRKKPAQPASGTQWISIGNTLTTVSWRVWGHEVGLGWRWRLPAFLCQTTSSPGFCPISWAHFRDRKTLRKRVHHKGPPLYARSAVGLFKTWWQQFSVFSLFCLELEGEGLFSCRDVSWSFSSA